VWQYQLDISNVYKLLDRVDCMFFDNKTSLLWWFSDGYTHNFHGRQKYVGTCKEMYVEDNIPRILHANGCITANSESEGCDFACIPHKKSSFFTYFYVAITFLLALFALDCCVREMPPLRKRKPLLNLDETPTTCEK